MHFFYSLLLHAFYVFVNAGGSAKVDKTADHGVEAEKGIVKGLWLGEPNKIPTDFIRADFDSRLYKQFLECAYDHPFQDNDKKPHNHMFSLRCIEVENKGSYLYLYFNKVLIERMEVISCDKKKVQQSIFPPRRDHVMNNVYNNVYNGKETSLFPHIVHKNELGECYEYSYRVDFKTNWDKFTFINRGTPIRPRNCKSDGVEFICQAPSMEMKRTVMIAFSMEFNKQVTWAPCVKPGCTKLLECSVRMPQPKNSDFYFKLICVKAPKAPPSGQDKESSGDEFFAFVRYSAYHNPFESFTVTSCDEEDIVNAIFMPRDGSLNGRESMRNANPPIRILHANGKCYILDYDRLEHFMYSGVKLTCPRSILEWVNPKESSLVMWRNCEGPMSIIGKPEIFPTREGKIILRG